MRKTAALITAAAIFLAAGCSEKSPSNKFYPMNAGSEWIYQTESKSHAGTDASEIIQTEAKSSVKKEGGKEYRLISYSVNSSDKLKTEYYIMDGENISLAKVSYNGKDMTFNPPMMILPSENYDKDEWNWEGEGSFGKGKASFKQTKADIVSKDPYIVATRVDSTINAGGRVIRESKWFCMDCGLVKSSCSIEKDGKIESEITSKITNFSITKENK